MKPVLDQVVKVLPVDDPWERHEQFVPLKRFGSGCMHEWPWYFEGRSAVRVTSVKELCRWLLGCRYVTDTQLFNERDFWQHPLTFEAIRQGDCEDHALWAWRKLTEIGINAEFVAGRSLVEKQPRPTRHACVIYEESGRRYALNPTGKRGMAEMILPLWKARAFFWPEYSVDSSFKTYRFGGAALALQHFLQNGAADPGDGADHNRGRRRLSKQARTTRVVRIGRVDQPNAEH